MLEINLLKHWINDLQLQIQALVRHIGWIDNPNDHNIQCCFGIYFYNNFADIKTSCSFESIPKFCSQSKLWFRCFEKSQFHPCAVSINIHVTFFMSHYSFPRIHTLDLTRARWSFLETTCGHYCLSRAFSFSHLSQLSKLNLIHMPLRKQERLI